METKCPIAGCNKPIAYGRKTCEMHYYRLRRNGSYTLFPKKKQNRPIQFEITDSGCFEVTSHKQLTSGYFHIQVLANKRKLMHRLVYEECFGEIPYGVFVCHKCDNKKCINPEHLELGTPKKNVQDAIKRGLKPHRPKFKLSESDVQQIKFLLNKGDSNKKIAAQFSVDPTTISDIKRGKTWDEVKPIEVKIEKLPK